nr:hypothetical protein [Aeromonas veronii]
MRKDLLDLVFDMTRSPGFQEEKYESYILQIHWDKGELRELIERRINEVFRKQYTKEQISFDDIFPTAKKGKDQTSADFILERTLYRPRDVLQFINECFKSAYGRDCVSWRAIYAAEAQYSEKRLKSLKEEWGEIYPSFDDTVEILRGLPHTFTRSVLSGPRLDNVISDLCAQNNNDPCVISSKEYLETTGETKLTEVLNRMLICLYHVGAIGIKNEFT